MPSFAKISLNRWRQFKRIDIDLSNRLTILTGPNGSGKTTVLNILAQHFGWSYLLAAAPSWSRKKRKRFYSDIHAKYGGQFDGPHGDSINLTVGTVSYTDQSFSSLIRPNSENPNYKLILEPSNVSVHGHIVPSHLPPPSQVRLDTIPVDPVKTAQSIQSYTSFIQQLYGASERARNPGRVFKESLLSLALFSYDTPGLRGDPELRHDFESFQKILQQTLPESVGFQNFEIVMPDIVLVTKSGRFPLEAASGGVNTIIMLAWQLYLAGKERMDFTVIIDEPENHLHPSMQRELLPKLLSSFPSYKFIVATHSPFIVTSDPDASVYALLPDSTGEISSEHMTMADLAASPDEILREVLDVGSLLPHWVEQRINAIFERHRGSASESEQAAAIYKDLKMAGLLGYQSRGRDDAKPQ